LVRWPRCTAHGKGGTRTPRRHPARSPALPTPPCARLFEKVGHAPAPNAGNFFAGRPTWFQKARNQRPAKDVEIRLSCSKSMAGMRFQCSNCVNVYAAPTAGSLGTELSPVMMLNKSPVIRECPKPNNLNSTNWNDRICCAYSTAVDDRFTPTSSAKFWPALISSHPRGAMTRRHFNEYRPCRETSTAFFDLRLALTEFEWQRYAAEISIRPLLRTRLARCLAA
jgi:hypothetical protein